MYDHKLFQRFCRALFAELREKYGVKVERPTRDAQVFPTVWPDGTCVRVYVRVSDELQFFGAVSHITEEEGPNLALVLPDGTTPEGGWLLNAERVARERDLWHTDRDGREIKLDRSRLWNEDRFRTIAECARRLADIAGHPRRPTVIRRRPQIEPAT